MLNSKRNLAALLAAIFLIACAEELWARFVPNYLRALGASIAWISVYGMLKDFLDAVYQFPGGLLTARLGYKHALVLFNTLAIAGYAIFALAQSWWVLILALPLVMSWQSFSLPATFSLIGDSLPQGQRSLAFAYQSIVRRIPIVIAPIVGGTIITAYGVLTGTRVAIGIGVMIALAALCLQATRYHLTEPSLLSARELIRDVARLRPALKSLLAADIIVRFGQGIGEIFIVLFVVDVIGLSSATFGWLVGLAMTTSLVVYVPVARAADRRGRAPFITLTYAFFALFPLVLSAASKSWILLILAFVLMGLREIGEPPRKALIADLARSDRRSVDVGTYYFVRGLAVFPASLIGGILWRYSPEMTFTGAGIVAGIGMLVFAVQSRSIAVAPSM